MIATLIFLTSSLPSIVSAKEEMIEKDHHLRRKLAKKKVTLRNNCLDEAVAYVVKDDPYFWTPVDFFVLCAGETAEYHYDGDYVFWYAVKTGTYGDDDTMQSCTGTLYSPFCDLNPQTLDEKTLKVTFCNEEESSSVTDSQPTAVDDDDDDDEEDIVEPKNAVGDDEDDEEETPLPPDRPGD